LEAEMLEMVDQSDLVDQSEPVEPAERAEGLARAVQARRSEIASPKALARNRSSWKTAE
jgi:hypothetical protein